MKASGLPVGSTSLCFETTSAGGRRGTDPMLDGKSSELDPLLIGYPSATVVADKNLESNYKSSEIHLSRQASCTKVCGQIRLKSFFQLEVLQILPSNHLGYKDKNRRQHLM